MKALLTLSLVLASATSFADGAFYCEKKAEPGSESRYALQISVRKQALSRIQDVSLVDHMHSFLTPVKIRLPWINRSDNYKPKNPRYQGMHKFVINVPNLPACSYTLIVPPQEGRPSKFNIYVQMACDSYYETHTLGCVAK